MHNNGIQKKAKVLKVFSHLSWISMFLCAFISLGFGKFLVTGLSLTLFFAGLGFLFEQGSRKAMEKERDAEIKKGFLYRHDPEEADERFHAPEEKQHGKTNALNVSFDHALSISEAGRAFAKEVDKANDLIPDEKISEDLYAICRHINDIFATAANDSSAEREIKKFSGIYLPKMLKLCNLYIELDAKQVQTQKVLGLKEQIGASIANIRCAFANFNDNLINRASIDIEAEIQSFEELLTIDGLLGKRQFTMPEKKEQEEKI